jgi:F0F1-type ATP synthase membrane subunit b/b'
MTGRLRNVGLLLAVMGLPGFAAIAHAAEEAGGPHGVVTVIFRWIHFAILAAIVFWLFRWVLPPIFRHNADNISSAITKATAAKAEAERQLQEAEAKFARLEQEVAAFRAQAQKDAAAELDRIRALTKIDAEKIHIAAKAEVEAAERAARVELKALAAKLAVDRAESLLTKELTPAVQDNMISSFVESLQRRPN